MRALLDYVGNRYGVATRYLDANSLLTNSTLDAVFILTPDHLHADLLEQAIRSGKHVFIEKPACLTADQEWWKARTQSLADAERQLAHECGNL